jgi:cell division protein FtsQ
MDTLAPDDVVDSVARFERRQWGRRLRGWRPLFIAVLATGLVVFLAWVVLISSWLGMQHLRVAGTHRVSPADVTRAADIAPGTPLARLDLGAIEARVEAIPAVAAATVHRSWPRSVEITVVERRPVAAVSLRGRWWLMDRTGALFGASSRPDPGQPVVDLGSSAGIETRGQVAVVLAALPPDLAAACARVTAATQDSIELHLRDGAEVQWGSSSDSVEKASVLRALLHLKARYYDVSVPGQPATRG